MKINCRPQISFQSLRMKQLHGINFPENFDCSSRRNKKYNVSVHEEYDAYQIYFSDNKYRPLPNAEQEITLYKDQDYMYVDNMYTQDSFRGDGLGICMHLVNIIEMFENDNIKRIELFATSEAIPFHSKFGFRPCENWNNATMLKNIRAIAADDTPELSQYSLEAAMLLKTYISPELKSQIGNKIIHNYIQKAVKIKSKAEQKEIFESPIQMVLTRENVMNNKKFYNKLFKKYKIDYQI